MTVKHLKESTYIPDMTFPINVFHIKAFPLHWHDHMEWIIVKEGKARVQIDDTFIHLQKGEFAFINSKQLHASWLLEEETELIAVVFNEAIIRNNGLDNTENLYLLPYLNHKQKLPNFLKSTEPYVEKINESINNLIKEFEQKENGFELLIKAELFRIFGLIFRYNTQLEEHSIPRIQKKYNMTVLLDYLRENYHQEMTVNEAAKMVSLSPNHFCKVFKRVTGKTLIEYLHLLRINEAERMLLETDWPVTEIAEKVGFSSITYFGRVFKKIKNMPPSIRRSSH